jgi:hypothetical protein
MPGTERNVQDYQAIGNLTSCDKITETPTAPQSQSFRRTAGQRCACDRSTETGHLRQISGALNTNEVLQLRDHVYKAGL